MKVTGFTAKKMQEIIGKLFVSGHIDGDDLVLVTTDGTEIDIGSVRGPQGVKGDTGGDITGVKQLLSPTGIISPYGGTAPPAGWLICDGTSYLRTTYPDLFAVIGTIYGAADPTHFNVPDLQGRFPVGRASVGNAGDPLLVPGAKAGNRNATVISHSHPHHHSITPGGIHSHTIDRDAGDRIVISKASPAPFAIQLTSSGSLMTAAFSHINNSDTHNHGGTTGDDSTAAGVSGVDANFPPYQVVNYIIRYGT